MTSNVCLPIYTGTALGFTNIQHHCAHKGAPKVIWGDVDLPHFLSGCKISLVKPTLLQFLHGELLHADSSDMDIHTEDNAVWLLKLFLTVQQRSDVLKAYTNLFYKFRAFLLRWMKTFGLQLPKSWTLYSSYLKKSKSYERF